MSKLPFASPISEGGVLVNGVVPSSDISSSPDADDDAWIGLSKRGVSWCFTSSVASMISAMLVANSLAKVSYRKVYNEERMRWQKHESDGFLRLKKASRYHIATTRRSSEYQRVASDLHYSGNPDSRKIIELFLRPGNCCRDVTLGQGNAPGSVAKATSAATPAKSCPRGESSWRGNTNRGSEHR